MLDKFDQAAELVVFPTGVSAETGAEEEKKGSDSLTAAIQDMRRHRINEGDAGGQILVDPFFDPFKLISIGVPDVRHRMNRRGDRTLWHAADGRAEQETKSRERL